MQSYVGKLKTPLYIVLLLFALVITVNYFQEEVLWEAYRFLVVTDPIKKADVIVAVGGGYLRIDEACSLFHEEYAKELIITGRLITKDVSTADLWLKRALKLGIPREAIHIIRDSTSTYEDATFVGDTMRRNGLRKALLTTSPYHTRRVKWLFNRAFSQNGLVVVGVVPGKEEVELWENRSAKGRDPLYEKVALEYIKILWYFLYH
jgi:uncharacterized SAM-binding protein YcdF (DUF218 family)